MTSIVLYGIIFCGLYFQIFLLVSFFEENSQDPETTKIPDHELPRVSITVPCFNESRTVRATVESLRALNYPQDKLSILIVDDGSTDNTFEIAKSLEIYPNVKAVSQKNGGKFTALNRGISESTADFVGCLDADSFVHPNALRSMIAHFGNDPKIVAVTPAMVVHEPKTLIQKMQSAEYMIGIFAKMVMGKLNAIHVTPGPFSIFRKSIFKEIGLFRHAHMTEDMEIAFRIQKNKYRIVHCPDAFVYTITPNTVNKLYRQRTRWVYGFIRNAFDYRHMLFKKEYGNMATLTLPYAVFGIIAVFYLTGTAVAQAAGKVWNNVEHIRATGFMHYFNTVFGNLSFNFDWFFVNSDITLPLGFIMFIGAGFIMIQGRKMAEGVARPSLNMLYFIMFYGFIAPFWIAKASYRALRATDGSWR
jgi:cellulose synthase/poly-beta-1,6-N-acetylglucosamine synthase-like glycosyltransferase